MMMMMVTMTRVVVVAMRVVVAMCVVAPRAGCANPAAQHHGSDHNDHQPRDEVQPRVEVLGEDRSTGTVVRIDAATGRRDGAAIAVGAAPTDIAVAGGRVWVANSEDGTVTPIDAASGQAGSPIRVAEHQVLALAAGPSGVWVAKSDRPEADPIEIVRIDPRSGRLDGPAVRVPGASPMRLAVADKTVWVTDAGQIPALGKGRAPALVRVDPRQRARAGQAVELDGRPAGLAIGRGQVWVALGDQNTVTSVTLPGR